MRIVGGHDYYDGAAPYDADNTRVFVRELKGKAREVKLPVWGSHDSLRIEGNQELFIQPTTVIFCGRIYRGWRLSDTWGTDFYYSLNKNSLTYVWSLEALVHWLNERGAKISPESRVRKKGLHLLNIVDYFKVESVSPVIMDQLISERVLIAVNQPPDRASWRGGGWFDTGKWKVNTDELGKMKFPLHAYQAYQELEMFLGTILVNDRDSMAKLSDAERAVKHGFDEYSFRDKMHRAKPRGRRKSG